MAETSIRFKVETKDANKKVAQLEKQIRKLEVAVVKSGGTTRTAGSGFKAFGSSAAAASVGVRGFGAALSAALGPVTAVFAAVGGLSQIFGVLKAQDFAEAKVKTLGVNTEELKGRLSGVSRELSGQASVLDLTSAAYDVASAGFNNAADASLILKAASQGATGGFSDLNTVGDATTSVLNAYGLEADKAGKLVDGFIQTQNDGKIVIGEYAANIAKVAPIASALGVPLEEVNAAVAQITGGGEKAEVTFTSLKNAFAQIAGGKVGKEFKKFGVEINAATLKSDGLVGTLDKIKQTGAETGDIIKAFGIEGGQAIITLLGNTEKYNQLLQNQKNSQGAAAKAAFEASDTIEGSIKRLSTAFQNIISDGSELGLIVKGTFLVAAVTVEALGAALKLAMAPARGIIDGFKLLFDAILPIEEGVNIAFELEEAWKKVLGVIDTLTGGVSAFFSVFVQSIGELTGVVINFGIDLNEALGNPIGNAIDLYGEWMNVVFGVFNSISQAASGFFNSFVSSAGSAVTNVVKFFSGLFNNLIGIIQRFQSILPSWLQDSLSGATGAAVNVVKAIGTAVSSVQEIVKAVPEKVTTFFAAEAVKQKSTETASAANNVQSTNGALKNAAKEKQVTEKETDEEKQLKAAEKLVLKLERKNELDAAATEEARKLLELKFAQDDIEEKFNLAGPEKIQQLKDLLQANHDITEEKNKQKLLDDAAKKKADETAEAYKKLGDAIKSNVTDAIIGAIEGTKSLGESALEIMKQLAKQFLLMGINNFFSGLGSQGGILGLLFPGRASGGTVSGGRSYMVGERGPELFTPGRTGSIAPNDALGGGASVTVNVDASGSNVEGSADQAAQLGKVIGVAVQQELIKQRRPGGLLTG